MILKLNHHFRWCISLKQNIPGYLKSISCEKYSVFSPYHMHAPRRNKLNIVDMSLGENIFSTCHLVQHDKVSFKARVKILASAYDKIMGERVDTQGLAREC